MSYSNVRKEQAGRSRRLRAAAVQAEKPHRRIVVEFCTKLVKANPSLDPGSIELVSVPAPGALLRTEVRFGDAPLGWVESRLVGDRILTTAVTPKKADNPDEAKKAD